MQNSKYQDEQLKGKQLADSLTQTKTGSQTQNVTETNIWEDGKDVIRRFKPTPHYIDPSIAAQGGVEQMLFGGGPNLQAANANAMNAQLFQQYQQMGMPHVTPAQAKLKSRILGTTTSSENTMDKSAAEQAVNGFANPATVQPFSPDGTKNMMLVGLTNGGDQRMEFIANEFSIPKKIWDKMPHWNYLKGLVGKDGDVISEWKEMKNYLEPHITFELSGDKVIIRTRASEKLGMNQKVADLLINMFSTPITALMQEENLKQEEMNNMASADYVNKSVADNKSKNTTEYNKPVPVTWAGGDGDSGDLINKVTNTKIKFRGKYYDAPDSQDGAGAERNEMQSIALGQSKDKIDLASKFATLLVDSLGNANLDNTFFEASNEPQTYGRDLGRLFNVVTKFIGGSVGASAVNARHYWDQFLEKEKATMSSLIKMAEAGQLDDKFWADIEARVKRLADAKGKREGKKPESSSKPTESKPKSIYGFE